jgi:cysteine dioxygenase
MHATNNLFSSSPTSTASPIFIDWKLNSKGKLTLEEFIDLVPTVIRNHKQTNKHIQKNKMKTQKENQNTHSQEQHDPIANLFQRLQVTPEEISHYSFITEEKNYTRNLISTDDETYTLLLLCWNPNKASPIHDHPCDGCWMRILQGCINEKRFRYEYVLNDNNDGACCQEPERGQGQGQEGQKQESQLVCTQDSTFREGGQTFIDDNLGLHKIGNPGNELAISMHLYSPPFNKCRIWMDERNGMRSSVSCMVNFSEYGSLLR